MSSWEKTNESVTRKRLENCK